MKRMNMKELRPQIGAVWRLSLPAILTQITTIAMQYIDSAMVGALGANASASIGLVTSSTWLLSGGLYAVSTGFSVQVAHHIGGGTDTCPENTEAWNKYGVERHIQQTHQCIEHAGSHHISAALQKGRSQGIQL